MAGDGQTQAAAPILPCGRSVGLGKRFEEFLDLFASHAYAIVADAKDEITGPIAAFARDLEGDDALVGKFTGIAEEVEERLADLGGVGAHRAEVFFALDVE